MKISMILGIIFLTTLSSSISLPSERQSFHAGFNCAKATSIIEKTICGTKELADEDVHLNSIYKSILQILSAPEKGRFKNEQMRWLKNRDTSCGSSKNIIDCVTDAYNQRIELFRTLKRSAEKNLPSYGFRFKKDPSLVSLKPLPEEPLRSRERYRIIADFNNDGINDVALSYETSMFGNAGGDFFLYLGMADGHYKEIGSFFAHPAAINFKKTKKGEGLITTYIRSNAGSGFLAEQRVTSEGIFFLGRKTIQPGDFGPQADQNLYANLFGSGNCLNAEISETKDDIVTWKINN